MRIFSLSVLFFTLFTFSAGVLNPYISRSQDSETGDLTIGERKQIFKEIVQAEDRANREAESAVPEYASDGLEIGDTFQLTKETPLMPSREHKGIDSLKAIIYIPASGKFSVLKVDYKKSDKFNTWYYVKVTSPSSYASTKG